MALLLFRFYLVFVLGLLLLNGFANTSVSAFVNKAGPDRLRLTESPPANVLITAIKNSPVYLPCHAETDIDSSDWIDSDMDMDEGDYDNNGNDDSDNIQPPDMDRQDFYDDSIDLNNLYRENMHINTHNNDLYDEDEYEEENPERYRRSSYAWDHLIEYIWYRNGLEFLSTAFQNQNHRQTHKGFRLFPNGTLRIPYNRQLSNISAGVYRCKANLTRHGAGSILSTESVVTIASLERNNVLIPENNSVIAYSQRHLLLNCPFDSHPPANISWMVNKTVIVANNYVMGSHENRYYQLQNGSLFLTDIRPSDAGRYRCNATNNFAAKNFRSYSYVVYVQPPLTKPSDKLLPKMQAEAIFVRAGSTLKLNCAAEAGRAFWTFTPKASRIPINLVNYTYQLLITNASVDRHEGTYNCSYGNDSQLFTVTVLVPPTFLNNMTSYVSSVVASMSFNCSVSGNPKPNITWYKNGREIKASYIIHYNYSLLQINTIDPEDEGLYQCIAKNDAGEASVSMYLTIRDKERYRPMSKRPDSIQCFPIDTSSLYVRFERSIQNVNTEYVMYYLASNDPYSWHSSPPTQLHTNNSLKITGSMVTPFKNYTVYLRACAVTNIPDGENTGPSTKKQVVPSRLSRGVQCTSQGVPVLSMFFPNGIFISWPRLTGVEPTAYTIQFKHNESANLPFTSEQITGTTQILDNYITYEEVEPFLEKIDLIMKHYRENILDEVSEARRRKRRRRAFDMVKNPKTIFDSLTGTQLELDTIDNGGHSNSSKQNDMKYQQVRITQMKIPGNITGLLIPNATRLVIRILGSVAPNGEPMQQDLRYVQWKTIDSQVQRPDTVNRFQTSHVDARSVQFTWSRFNPVDMSNSCLMLCYKNVNHDVLLRGGSNRINCVNMPNYTTYYNLMGLSPFTQYKAFLKPCQANEPISDVADFQTKQDVPGPVTNHALTRKDGITLSWGPPENRNGILLGYLIEWVDKDMLHNAANLSIEAKQYKFPNVSTDDKINISIRAIGSTGIGIPIYMNLLNHIDITYENDLVVYFPYVEIIIGIVVVLFVLLFCCLLIIHKWNCKKANRNQALTVATGQPLHSSNCNADIHEMQTLIRTAEELPVLVPNGKCKHALVQKGAIHLEASHPLEHVRDVGITSNADSMNGKPNTSPPNKNGLVQQPNISSVTTPPLLPNQQQSVSSYVLGTNLSIPTKTLSKTNYCSDVPGKEPKLIPIAISNNSIYHKRNSDYCNATTAHCEPGADRHHLANCKGSLINSTGESNQLQPKPHSFGAFAITPTATIIPNNLAEQVPSSAATSISLSSASNFSTASAGSSGSTISSCSIQSQLHNRQQPHTYPAGSGKYNKYHNDENIAIDSSAVRITENPQYSANTALDGYNSSSAVNTSLFDSSQRRLLDLTIDSNSIETYDDDVTNCDNEDANQSGIATLHTHTKNLPNSQKNVRPRLISIENDEDDNNNEQQAGDGVNFPSSCTQHPQHHQQLLNPRHLVHQCSSVKRPVVGQTEDIDDENTSLDGLDNTTALLNESSISTKPLHQQHTSSWNFRRPIVGPNG